MYNPIFARILCVIRCVYIYIYMYECAIYICQLKRFRLFFILWIVYTGSNGDAVVVLLLLEIFYTVIHFGCFIIILHVRFGSILMYVYIYIVYCSWCLLGWCTYMYNMCGGGKGILCVRNW